MKITAKLKIVAGSLHGRAGLLLRDESGQDLIEYALVASLLALGAIASMRSVGDKLSASFANIASSVSAA